MALVLVGGSFETLLPESKIAIVNEKGVAVAASYYSTVDSTAVSCTITGIMQIEATGHTLESGDEVFIKIGSKNYSNIVNGIDGDEVSFVNRLPLSSGSATVKYRFNTVTLTDDVAQGSYYLLPNNELLVVRSSYNDPYITIGELAGQYRDALTVELGMEVLVNKTALSKIYSDLRGVADVYDIIYFERIRQLKKLAMLMMLFPSVEEHNIEYYKILESTRLVKTKDKDRGVIVKPSVAKSDWGGF